MSCYRSFIICTSPRSGSTLLCKLLAATQISGKPDSHFHVPSIDKWLSTYELSPDQFDSEKDALKAIFSAARQRGTGTTGMFGLRLQRASFDFFMQQLDILHPRLSSDVARIHAAFGETLFIHLSRSDKLAQAISLVKAMQTGLWHKAPDGTELERSSDPQDPVFDAGAIEQELTSLTAMDEEWNTWFDAQNIKPLRVSYSALSADPIGTLCGILDQLGLDHEVAHDIIIPVAKLADATSLNWEKRFQEANIS